MSASLLHTVMPWKPSWTVGARSWLCMRLTTDAAPKPSTPPSWPTLDEARRTQSFLQPTRDVWA